MKNIVVVGSQWGDEGKGKIVDWLSEQADVVIRFQGGHNAGHTLVIDGVTYKLRLLPSGIVRKGKISIIGNGVVVDPWALLEEIEEIKSKGVEVNVNNFIISESANLILPFHREMDEIREDAAGKSKIGTTRRGIGPAYEDKVGRRSIRVMDLRSEKNLDQRLDSVLVHHNAIRKGLGKKIFEKDQLKSDLLKIAPKILEFSQPVWLKIDQFKKQKKRILFEGAQGILLDVDHGTYPFVTSSNTLAGGACAGTGIGPTRINEVMGIVKAYTTRVGSGPFPTELLDNDGELLQSEGHEFGATTGRPRRCGWFDALLVRQAVRLNGITSMAVMKLDVLDKFDTLKIAVSYRLSNGEHTENLPRSLENVTPVLEEMPGWKCNSAGITEYDQLPRKMLAYLERISELVGAKVSIISTGPKREETIVLNPDQFWL